MLKARSEEVVAAYLAGTQVAARFGVAAPTVHRLMVSLGVARRDLSKANSAAWDATRRDRQRQSRTGKPSPAQGKRWVIGRPIERPGVSGSKNGQWKGGVSSLSEQVRKLSRYRHWRDGVYRRDDYTCVFCGTRSARGKGRVLLNADHIIPLAKLLHTHKILTIADANACAALWDEANGRTLCHACHRQTDTFGKNIRE